MNQSHLCPCGSGTPYTECCGAIISGRKAALTAEQLMRSRYTAFTEHNYDYLEQSWHPETRQKVSDNHEELDKTQWKSLRILNNREGKQNHTEGSVTFVARFTSDDEEHELCEKSLFRKIDDRWYYYQGEPSRAPVEQNKTSRNAACPCGSGKKYKRCCGA